ncbi:hypothetical protein BDV12DRAFT_150639 [Aspergillus spectabilis]
MLLYSDSRLRYTLSLCYHTPTIIIATILTFYIIPPYSKAKTKSKPIHAVSSRQKPLSLLPAIFASSIEIPSYSLTQQEVPIDDPPSLSDLPNEGSIMVTFSSIGLGLGRDLGPGAWAGLAVFVDCLEIGLDEVAGEGLPSVPQGRERGS